MLTRFVHFSCDIIEPRYYEIAELLCRTIIFKSFARAIWSNHCYRKSDRVISFTVINTLLDVISDQLCNNRCSNRRDDKSTQYQ